MKKTKPILLASLIAVLTYLLLDRFPYAFDYSTHAVSPDEIMSGGPGKDGIPSLTNPHFVKAKEAYFMRDNEKVMGIVIGGKARAYPIRVLSWHEAVNDKIGPVQFLVTW